MLDLTRGELGTRGSAELRDEEAANSARKMGALVRENARMADGFFEHSPENIIKIVEVVRRYQPTIVLANSLHDRHPDHGRAAKLIQDACFYSGLAKIETHDTDGTPQERWRPQNIYHYIQDYDLKPDFVVDVTPFWEHKKELIFTFRSQFFDADGDDKELSTPISGKDFVDFLDARGRNFGRAGGCEFGEGFQVARTLGINDLFELH